MIDNLTLRSEGVWPTLRKFFDFQRIFRHLNGQIRQQEPNEPIQEAHQSERKVLGECIVQE